MMSIGVRPKVVLPEFWSPTLLNTLKACPLQLAYSLDPEIKPSFEKLNTYSAMGICAHQLTERAWKSTFVSVEDGDLEVELTRAWTDLVQEQFQRLREDWSPAQVPVPRDWPYFAVTQVRTIARVAQEVRSRSARAKGNRGGTARVERKISDSGRRIEGIPDRVIVTAEGYFVLDLKTGHSISEISESHRRQLLLYAHLVAQTTDVPLLAIGVVKAGGDVIWEDAREEDVARVLNEASDELALFESASESGDFSTNCDPYTCRYCPYKLICSSFWSDPNPEWWDFRGVVGRVVEVTNERSFSLEQRFPGSGKGQVLTVSNLCGEFDEGDLVAITDCSVRGRNVRGSWYSRAMVVDV